MLMKYLIQPVTHWHFGASNLSLDLRSTNESHDLVSHSEALTLARKLKITYMETSTLTQEGVKACFEYAVSFSHELIL